jgi:hypothetical protein
MGRPVMAVGITTNETNGLHSKVDRLQGVVEKLCL